jgi:hypothetical protein
MRNLAWIGLAVGLADGVATANPSEEGSRTAR